MRVHVAVPVRDLDLGDFILTDSKAGEWREIVELVPEVPPGDRVTVELRAAGVLDLRAGDVVIRGVQTEPPDRMRRTRGDRTIG